MPWFSIIPLLVLVPHDTSHGTCLLSSAQHTTQAARANLSIDLHRKGPPRPPTLRPYSTRPNICHRTRLTIAPCKHKTRTGCRSTQPRQSSPRRSSSDPSSDPPRITGMTRRTHDREDLAPVPLRWWPSQKLVGSVQISSNPQKPKAKSHRPGAVRQSLRVPHIRVLHQPGSLLDYCQSWVLSVSDQQEYLAEHRASRTN